MVGQRGNARGKQGGSLLDTLRDETVYLQVKWLKCFEVSAKPEADRWISYIEIMYNFLTVVPYVCCSLSLSLFFPPFLFAQF